MSRSRSLRRLLVAITAVAALWLAGCGEDPPTCGKGTRLDGDRCVPVGLSCGPGTEAVGGTCQPLDAGSDTVSGEDAIGGQDSGGSGGDAGLGDTGAPDTGPSCVPNCVGRDCGDDGCGGSCGTCTNPGAPVCNTTLGVCAATCVPACEGKTCGDDGCGGTCGACAAGLDCDAKGRCLPPGWSCNPAFYGAGDACDCGCGAKDPDCELAGAFLSGCASLQTCDDTGVCVDKVPKAWTCPETTYDALDACNCGCGAPDPDCAVDSLGVLGCGQGQVCKPDGTCGTCTPDCKGKQCGDDGCGGSCGACTQGKLTACDAGTCVDPCGAKPLLCKTAVCGTDGCGGSCGTCPSYAACDSGQCKAIPLPEAATSCVNKCGSKADSGCLCAPGCKAQGTCCKDFADVCSCKPDCAGKQCGDDGCGGSCGACGSGKPFCDAKQQCVASCTKQCAGKACGADGCGGSCGTCAAGSTCAWTQQCVPSGWHCPDSYYADGKACDCGCGAVDPDCATGKLVTFGCPASDTACGAKGLCKVDFCARNGDCAKGWCKGLYRAGSGVYKGVCGTPDQNAKAPGASCSSSGECATGVCVGGQCRLHCQGDADCAGTQRCVGLAVPSATSGKVVGYAGLCASIPGAAGSCSAQKACKTGVCTALVDPKTFGPQWLCAFGQSGGGSSCATASCPTGQLCAPSAKGPVCGLGCPAGDADCGSAATCTQTTFHDQGTQATGDDPKVPVCVPK